MWDVITYQCPNKAENIKMAIEIRTRMGNHIKLFYVDVIPQLSTLATLVTNC